MTARTRHTFMSLDTFIHDWMTHLQNGHSYETKKTGQGIKKQVHTLRTHPSFNKNASDSYSATDFFSASTLFNFSHGKSKSVRPKCP